MSERPLVVMALPGESEDLVEAAGVTVGCTGHAKVNAAYALTRALTEAKARGEAQRCVLNLGSAGSHPHALAALLKDYC